MMFAIERELAVARGLTSCRGDDDALDEAERELDALRTANVKLAGAINLIREALNGGEVQDLHQIINAALDAHEKTMTPNAKVSGAGTASAGLPGWQANGGAE